MLGKHLKSIKNVQSATEIDFFQKQKANFPPPPPRENIG